jgi:hypothetical protein
MRINGSLDLLGNVLKNFALEPVETWPEVPKPGTFIFKPPRVYICLEIAEDVPVWLPMSTDLHTHIHDQFVASSEWIVEHNLNATGCIVQVLSGDSKAILYDEVEFQYNRVIIKFSQTQAGRAILVLGATEGIQRPQVAYEQNFVESSVWYVAHNLGYDPIVRCFVGTMEVQPISIVHDVNSMYSVVTFSNPVTGRVRCV